MGEQVKQLQITSSKTIIDISPYPTACTSIKPATPQARCKYCGKSVRDGSEKPAGTRTCNVQPGPLRFAWGYAQTVCYCRNVAVGDR
jgi:hypothetical protein